MQIYPLDTRGVGSLFAHMRGSDAPQEGPLWSLLRVGDAYSGDMSAEAYLKLGALAIDVGGIGPAEDDIIGGLWWVARRLLAEGELQALDSKWAFAGYLLKQRDSHARACGLRLKVLLERRGGQGSLLDGIAFSSGMWLHSAGRFDLLPDLFEFIASKALGRNKENRAA